MIPIFKWAGILLCFCTSFNTALAQTKITANDAPKYIGKTVDFLEMVSEVNFDHFSKSCTITFPHSRVSEHSPEISIIIHNVHGAKHINWLRSLPGNWLNIHGKLFSRQNKLIIDGDDVHTKLNIYSGTLDPAPENPNPPSADTSHYLKHTK